jgi:hypothetical protein
MQLCLLEHVHACGTVTYVETSQNAYITFLSHHSDFIFALTITGVHSRKGVSCRYFDLVCLHGFVIVRAFRERL